jgi:Alpha/beta hydrolase family
MDLEDRRRNLLLVHGAWHGPWCWEELTPALEGHGWNVHVVDLPSASSDSADNAGMYDDARTIRDHLDQIDGEAVIVAHSYGGIPVTQAAAGASNVAQIVYLAAFQLDVGDALVGAVDDPLPIGDSGTMQPPPDPIAMLYGDVAPDVADRAVALLVPQTVRSFNEQLTEAAWRTVPSVYLVCERDGALPVALQESMATRATTVHRLPSEHSPFLSMPDELARLLSAVADTAHPPTYAELRAAGPAQVGA